MVALLADGLRYGARVPVDTPCAGRKAVRLVARRQK